MEPDLFTAAAEERQEKDHRQPPGGPDAPRTLDESWASSIAEARLSAAQTGRRGQRRPGRPPLVILWVRPAPARRPRVCRLQGHQQALRRAVGDHRGREGGPRGHRRRPAGHRRLRQGDRPLPRRDPRFTARPSRTPCCRPSRTAGHPIAATTEKPVFSVISPLLSRSLLLTSTVLTDDDLRGLLRARATDERGLGGARRAPPRTPRTICCGSPAATPAGPDRPGGRRRCGPRQGGREIALTTSGGDRRPRRGEVRPRRRPALRVASALIKSIRGSDVDAAPHYLARMIEAGRTPGSSRRLMISASEDIGLADRTRCRRP